MKQWGYGAAPLLDPVTTEETEVVAFISDLHVPYHEEQLVQSTLRFLKKQKPHRVIINGDVADFASISRFNTAMERLDELQDEIDQANTIRKRIRKAVPNAQIIEVPGNHDIRLQRYIGENARAIKSLRALDPRVLYMHDALDIQSATDAGVRIRQNFLAYHGSIVRKNAGFSAKAELEKNQISGVSGHTHRLAIYHQAGYDPKVWVEGGGLFRLDPDYAIGLPNWQRGITVGQFSTKTPSFVLELVGEISQSLIYGGKRY